MLVARPALTDSGPAIVKLANTVKSPFKGIFTGMPLPTTD
jgi:hypothetical protein